MVATLEFNINDDNFGISVVVVIIGPIDAHVECFWSNGLITVSSSSTGSSASNSSLVITQHSHGCMLATEGQATI